MDVPECNYLDANLQNARDMNLNCVNNPQKGTDQYCLSEYKLYDNISQRSMYRDIKRGIDAGYGVLNSQNKIKKVNESAGIEGFTGKMFISDNGPGEYSLKPNKCPQGYKWCNQSNACVQVCMGCKYEDNMKSQEFNEADPCFPNGVYNGVTNRGDLKCTCGQNNKYCSAETFEILEEVFENIGLLLA